MTTFYRNFVSNVSHELKTPLTVIQGHVAAVGEGLAEDDSRQTALHIVAQEATRLTQLVDNLLLLSRLEMPNFTLERRPPGSAFTSARVLGRAPARPAWSSIRTKRRSPLPQLNTVETKLFQVSHRDVGVGWRLKPRLWLQSPPSGTCN